MPPRVEIRVWLIAIANANAMGEDGDTALTEGVTLNVPSMAQSSNTFKDYKPQNIGELIGDTTPHLPAVPRPLEESCNAIATLIVIVVQAVVLGYTHNPVLANYAGQVVGLALGEREEFSAKELAVSTATYYASVGAAEYLQSAGSFAGVTTSISTTTAGVTTSTLTPAGIAMQAGATVAATAAANKLVGNPSGFSWQNMAASMATAYVGAKIGLSDPSNPVYRASDTGGILFDTFSGIARAGMTHGIKRALGDKESHFNFRDTALDAFGNALGNSAVREIQAQSEFNAFDNYMDQMFAHVNDDDLINGPPSGPNRTKGIQVQKVATEGAEAPSNVEVGGGAAPRDQFELTPVVRDSNKPVKDYTHLLENPYEAYDAMWQGQMLDDMVAGAWNDTASPYGQILTPEKPAEILAASNILRQIDSYASSEQNAWDSFTSLFEDRKQSHSSSSTIIDQFGAAAASLGYAMEVAPRNTALSLVSKSLNQPVNLLRTELLKDITKPLTSVGETYAPISNAKSLQVLEKLNNNPLYKGARVASKILPGAYAATQLGEEVLYSVENNLSASETSLNVGSRALGTAVELVGAGAFIGEFTALGASVGVFFGGVGAVPGAIGGAVTGTVVYTFTGLGSAINNAVTNSTRAVIGWFQ